MLVVSTWYLTTTAHQNSIGPVPRAGAIQYRFSDVLSFGLLWVTALCQMDGGQLLNV